MSSAIDTLEHMFEHGGVSPAAATLTAEPSAATVVPSAPSQVTVHALQQRISAMQATKLDSRRIPTHPALANLLDGGLKQGAAYSVERSATLLMAMLSGPSTAGSWCAVVGVPEFGIEAAERFGIDLERLVLVPHPGDQWLTVTAGIADVMGVVVTRPPKRAADGAIARLSARLRQRGTTMFVLGTWPGSEAMLSLSQSEWHGIGSGRGHLTSREVTVTVSTKTAARPRSARLWLPDELEQFRVSERHSGQRPVERLQPVRLEATA